MARASTIGPGGAEGLREAGGDEGRNRGARAAQATLACDEEAEPEHQHRRAGPKTSETGR